MTQAHTLSKQPNRRKKKRVGRGNSSGKGTYSARGMKGQRARSGGKSGRKTRGLKKSLQKVPKVRGFHSMHAKAQTVSLVALERSMANGQEVTPRVLALKKIIRRAELPVKIVATGTLKKKLTITGCVASKTAIAAVEQAGGKIIF